MTPKTLLHRTAPLLIALASCTSLSAHAQVFEGISPKQGPDIRPHSYNFSNFVWWQDDALRSELKRRIPSLGDSLKLGSPLELRMRETLMQMIATKGIHAEVQIFEPSPNLDPAMCMAGSSCNAIVFSIAAPPQILVDHILCADTPDSAASAIAELDSRLHGRPYATGEMWQIKDELNTAMHNAGYLKSQVSSVMTEPPRKDGDRYLVSLSVNLQPGNQYRIGSVKIDGGPLLAGQDISGKFLPKSGDIATDDPTGIDRKFYTLRSFYVDAGYTNASLRVASSIDESKKLISYAVSVETGPLFHMGSLRVRNLDAQQEQAVRKSFPLKSGDVYNETVVTRFFQRFHQPDSPLPGYDLTFSPLKSKSGDLVDLTLDFYKR